MIEIITLGNFDIRYKDDSLLESIGNKHRLMKLFKYLLTFQGKKLLPENIIEDLCQEDYEEPINVLRTQISRIRRMFQFEALAMEAFFTIVFIDGYYIFKLKDNCFVDFLHMEKCIKEVECQNSDEIHDSCEEIIKLYKGDFLGELGNEDWLMPVRRRFERLYIKHVTKHLQHLLDKGLFNKILTICEEVMTYQPYEEALHIYYMEALVGNGNNKHAINHYSYCTTILFREFGESPSPRMKEIYKKIKNDNKKIQIDKLTGEPPIIHSREGALVCEPEQFEFILKYQKSLQEREKNKVFLGILTLDQCGLLDNKESDMRITSRQFMKFLQGNMRKGDILSKVDSNQVLLLFKTSQKCNIDCVMKRIDTCFQSAINDENIVLNIKLKNI